MKKSRCVDVIGFPLFCLMKDAKGFDSKIEAVQSFIKTGKPHIFKRFNHNYEIANEVLKRIVRDKPMLVEDFGIAEAAINRRYGAKRTLFKQGAFFVYLNKNEVSMFQIRTNSPDSTFGVVNTNSVRDQARKAAEKKKISKEYEDCQVLLAELDYIAKLSRKDKLEWPQKLPKLRHLAMLGS